jgi:hypothetical protein
VSLDGKFYEKKERNVMVEVQAFIQQATVRRKFSTIESKIATIISPKKCTYQ